MRRRRARSRHPREEVRARRRTAESVPPETRTESVSNAHDGRRREEVPTDDRDEQRGGREGRERHAAQRVRNRPARDDVAGGDHSDSRREEVDGSDAPRADRRDAPYRLSPAGNPPPARTPPRRPRNASRGATASRSGATNAQSGQRRAANRSSTPLNRSAARHFAVPSNRVRSASGYRSASTNTSDPLASAAQNDDGRGRDLDRDRDHSRTRSTSRRSPSRTRSARSSASLRSTVSASSVSSSRSSLRSNSRSSISPRA